jgi:tetratricopeptide (TPR) repeat protein
MLAANRSEDAARLEATGRAALSSRLPFADECLALAAEIDPFGDALDPLAQRLTAVEGAGEGASMLKRWADAAVATSPAVPTWRKLGLLLALNAGSVTRPTEIPPAPLGARFDALVLAPSSLRLTSTLAAQRARPQTIDAQAAVAQTLIATGDVAGAVTVLELCSRSPSVEGNSRAIGALLTTAAEIAKREPARARDMSRTAEALLPRLGRATSGDMLAAMRLAIVARSDEAKLERLSERLARASRPLTVADTNGCLELLNGVRHVDDDPFPAALLADAIARDTRAEAEARRRIARASIALGALSGGWWQRTESLLRDLASEGLEVFVRATDAPSANVDGSTVVVGTEGTVDLGRQFVRAADAHALIGDELGSRRLLERAVLIEPVSAEAQNNLAYFVVDRGAVDEATIAMSLEALAKAPDNPSILDTVGVLRYRQGRLRDGADGMGAITLFRQALRIRPEDPSLETLDHLGDALWQEGDQQAAIRCWQQVGQVAQLRYPPQEIAKNLVEFQRREFGLALLEPAPLLRRLYGRIADRAARKLEEVARGEPPSVRPMTLEAPGGMESGTNR